MKIITIGREFGSGGRELGKRLADELQIPCYDHEIIEEVAYLHNLELEHVEFISESDIRLVYPATIGRRFYIDSKPAHNMFAILVSEKNIIKSLAKKSDCVIVGLCADLILCEMEPLNLFVYADQESKIKRCMQYAEKNEDVREVVCQMQRIDGDRVAFRKLLTDSKWG